MHFSSEQELYDFVAPELRLSGHLVTDTVLKSGKTLYLIGERHGRGFLDAVSYAHETMVPKIKTNEQDWMFVFEAHEEEYESNTKDPDQVYFLELPRVMGVPVADIVQYPLEPDTKVYLLQNSDLSEIDIDSVYSYWFARANSSDGRKNPQQMFNELSRRLGKDADYALQVMTYATKKKLEIIDMRNRLIRSWNECIAGRLEQLLMEPSTKRNILVNIGEGHLPAFSSKYQNY